MPDWMHRSEWHRPMHNTEIFPMHHAEIRMQAKKDRRIRRCRGRWRCGSVLMVRGCMQALRSARLSAGSFAGTIGGVRAVKQPAMRCSSGMQQGNQRHSAWFVACMHSAAACTHNPKPSTPRRRSGSMLLDIAQKTSPRIEEAHDSQIFSTSPSTLTQQVGCCLVR